MEDEMSRPNSGVCPKCGGLGKLDYFDPTRLWSQTVCDMCQGKTTPKMSEAREDVQLNEWLVRKWKRLFGNALNSQMIREMKLRILRGEEDQYIEGIKEMEEKQFVKKTCTCINCGWAEPQVKETKRPTWSEVVTYLQCMAPLPYWVEPTNAHMIMDENEVECDCWEKKNDIAGTGREDS